MGVLLQVLAVADLAVVVAVLAIFPRIMLGLAAVLIKAALEVVAAADLILLYPALLKTRLLVEQIS